MGSKAQEILLNIDSSINKIKNKEHKVVFMAPDTKGNARASISNMYRQAMTLQELGYNAAILLEKKDSIKPSTWLGSEYDSLTHYSIEENNMVMGGHDFIVVPEVFGNVLEQIENLPMEKILFVQSFEYLLDSYAPGKSFMDNKVVNCLTTTENIGNMISEIFPGVNIKTIPLGISDNFKPTEDLTKPVVAIHCRDARKAAKIIKTFYLKYPIYRFISFRDMHTMTEKNFATNLKECCLSVWIDDESSFGTFPVESMKCNVPVVGKIPNLIPEWMTDNNGIWVYDENQIVDLISAYIKNWLEDNIPENLQTVSNNVVNSYTMTNFKDKTKEVYEQLFNERVNNLVSFKTEFLKQYKQ